MTLKEGTFIEAEYNGNTVSGYVLFNEKDEAFITGNNKLKVDQLANIKLSEATSDEDIDEIVNNDLERLDANKVKNMKDKDVEKVSQAREKELTDAGVKIKKGDYADKLTAGMKAMGVFSKVAKGDITMSDALKKYESTDKSNGTAFKESDLLADSDQMYGDTEIVNEADPTDAITTEEADIEKPADPVADEVESVATAVTAPSVDEPSPEEKLEPKEDVLAGFLDSSNEVTDDYLGTNDLSKGEENVIEDSITADPTDSDLSLFDDEFDEKDDDFEDYSTDDIEIKIKNPKNSPIEIKIDSAAEDEINDEIDAELDKFESGSPDFNEGAFLEHICKKYNINKESKLITESASIEEALCRVIEIVASKN